MCILRKGRKAEDREIEEAIQGLARHPSLKVMPHEHHPDDEPEGQHKNNKKEESQLKEAIKKAMSDEKGQDKGYFTISEVTSLLTTLPQTNWTESKVDRVIAEWYDEGRLVDRKGIGKYTPV